MLSGLLSILGTDRDSQNVLNRILHQEFFLQYDYIVLDCQPSLDLLVANALKSSDQLMIPVQADLLAYEGTDETPATFQKIKQLPLISKSQVRMLLTMYQKNTKMSNSVWEALKKSYGNMVFETPISFRKPKTAPPPGTAWSTSIAAMCRTTVHGGCQRDSGGQQERSLEMTNFDLPIQTLPTLEEAYGSVLGGSRMENTRNHRQPPNRILTPFSFPSFSFTRTTGAGSGFQYSGTRGALPADGSGIQRTAG